MNSTTESELSDAHVIEHVAKRARHHVHYEPLTDAQLAQLTRRLTALQFVPRGEVDDTRYEQLYSLLLRDLVRGPVVVQQFVRLGGIEIVCQAARHPHPELRAVAIRLAGAVGATLFMNDWPPCLHVTLGELSATAPEDPLVLDAVLRAWSSLAANDAITWSADRSRDLVALASHAWQHATHFVASSAVKLLHGLVVHERVIPQHVVDEIKQQVAWQIEHLSGDFKLVHAVLDLFAALVEHVRGCAVLARDRLMHDTVTRVIQCPQLFTDTHVNTRLLELIDAATRVNQLALFGSGSEDDPEQFFAWVELFLAPLNDTSHDAQSKEFEFAVRLLSHVNFPPHSRGAQWHVQQCRRVYSHVTGPDQHRVTFLICSNLLHHARKDQLQLIEHVELWEYLHNYLNDHVIKCQSRAAKLIEKNKRMILQLIGVLALKPNIDMSPHATAVLSYLTGQSRDAVTLPTHVPLVCNAVQCLTLLLSREGFDLTGVISANTLRDVCQLGLLHRTWEIRETFLRFVAQLLEHSAVVALQHVIADKLRDPEPVVVVAALQLFQDLTRDRWHQWHEHVLQALPTCLRHEDAVVRVTAWQVLASWHQAETGALFMAQCRTDPLSLPQHVTAACQDEDWEVRQAVLEWCRALVAHGDWRHLFELAADTALQQATTDPMRLVRLSAYRALHALFKQLHATPLTDPRAAALLLELRATDWARVMADQEPHAVYHEDDDVFPLEPDLRAPDSNQLDCPF